MRFTCQRESFTAAYQAAQSFVAQRSPKPILQNVKLEVGQDSGKLIATDTDVGIRITVHDLEVESGGQAILPSARFGMLLRESSDEKLRIESDGNNLVVRGERSVIKLPAQNPDEFPTVEEITDANYYQVSAPLLRTLIHRTVFATDTDSSRFALGGVLFEFDQDRLTAVATDGRRLAKMNGLVEQVGQVTRADQNTIVPTRALQLIDRALFDEQGSVALMLRPNMFVIRSSQAMIFSRLVEGRFPRWREVVPNAKSHAAVSLPVGPVYSALRQAAIVTDKESKGIDFAFEAGQLVLSARTANVGQTRVELPVAYDGPPVTLCLDNAFMADFMRVLDLSSNFTFHFLDAQSATMAETEDGYQYVVMPLAREHAGG
ncbi:MAG: DNA polymerase III subunit beta [Pirellulales bacterium]